MGDRENPIKFGPEWLRNFPRERGTGNTGSQGGNSQSTGPGPSGGPGPNTRRGGTSGDSSAGTAGGTSASANGTVSSRVQLANLRYGREEMLALYETAANPPPELTNNELLYQSRSKQPFALSTIFDDELLQRDGIRSSHTGAIPAERFGVGRGASRGLTTPDSTRPRFRTTGSTVSNRPRNLPSTSEGHFSGNSLEASVRPQLSQRNPRYQSNTEHRPMFYPNYVGANTFRSKRQTNTSSTNWRSSQAREAGDEWRSEPGRSRTGQDRERDRERAGPSSNRRSSDHEETIPEWAFANAEACGGTFDSSGAFHGYSNDDSNLPKNQDNGYSLSRSRTHNSLSRSKTVEEGSEEWWASEKAKKLSPKRFDAGDIKFKQGAGIQDGPLPQNLNLNANNEEQYNEPQKESPVESPEEPVKESGDFGDNNYNNNKGYKQQFSDSKPFDSMMRQDINIEEAHSSSANDQRGNFQSVMITPNNSLRQKHQNIVSAPNDSAMNRAQGLRSMKYTSHSHTDKNIAAKHQTYEEKILDDFLDLTLETEDLGASVLMGPSSGGGMANQSLPQMQERGLQQGLQTANLQNQGLSMNNVPNLSSLGMQGPGLAQGVANLNNPPMNPHMMSPQLEFGNTMNLPMQGVPQGGLNNGLHRGASALPAYQGSGIPGINNSNIATNSLFLGNSSNASGDIPMPSHGASMFPMHGLQRSGSQGAFSASVFNSMMQQPPPTPTTPPADQWYYEDPEKNVQGPFTSREMFNWYRAGFFTPSLMVRRACEREMRPLGSFGPLVPFVQLDVLPPYPMSGYDARPTMNQSGIGLGVMPISNNDLPIPMPPSAQKAMQNSFQNMQAAPLSSLHNSLLAPPIHLLQNTVVGQNVINMPPPPLMRTSAHGRMPVFGDDNRNRNPPVAQQQNVFDSLWGQAPQDVMWMQRNPPIENRVNNLPLYFWEQQPTAIAANQLLPEGIVKEMKTEDQILAQLRAAQNMSTQPNPAVQKQPEPHPLTSAAGAEPIDAFSSPITATYFELHQIIHKEPILPVLTAIEPTVEIQHPKQEKNNKGDQPAPEMNNTKPQQNVSKSETKTAKQSKESEKTIKVKDNNNTKSKNKKKDEKKDDTGDSKGKDDESHITEKRSVESSPVKSKKDEKSSKKDLDKEKKEWIKEGFTIVKGSEKGTTKDNKKKAEDARSAEAVEKKKKEILPSSYFVFSPTLSNLQRQAEEKRKLEEIKKQHVPQSRQAPESTIKKAPWSASQISQSTNMEGLTLAEIQRLEREKKLEQMKEQQQMMQMIAQQQAQQIAREQEMQANLAWAKRNTSIAAIISPSLAEIQAQEQVSRKQAAVGAPAPLEEERPPVSQARWGNAPNGGGFWDANAQLKNLETKPQEQKPQESKVQEPREQESKAEVAKVIKKKVVPASSSASSTAASSAATPPVKKPPTPADEFDTWCTTSLKAWTSNIDVPTFIGFLKDIESPYEVKDYVRCYLGETKESGDFARQFLERRSKLLRVGMVTPSDDLCSPALAINPRSNSQSDYQEVKGKGKKIKKNKMLKVDARFLGFSATAAEDRINVGDIDTV